MQPLCTGSTEMFFSNSEPLIFVAKRRCARCSYSSACDVLGRSLLRRTGQPNGTGIYGGKTEAERRAA